MKLFDLGLLVLIVLVYIQAQVISGEHNNCKTNPKSQCVYNVNQ